MPGVMTVPDRLLIGHATEELTTIVQCSTQRAWENHVAICHGAMPQRRPGSRSKARMWRRRESSIDTIAAEVIFAAFQERFVEAVQGLRMGDPTDRSMQLGPLARDDLRDSLERQIRRSTDQGAKILVGGRRQPGRGYYFMPTVLTVPLFGPHSC